MAQSSPYDSRLSASRLAFRPCSLLRSPVFAATRHRDFRLFLIGQFISLCGTWIQTVAQGWLVLQLTNSAFAVGLVTALGSLPILLLTLYGGVMADRVNKRKFVLMLQSLMVIEGLTLGILTLLHLITVHWVMGLAVFFGTAQRLRGADAAGADRRHRASEGPAQRHRAGLERLQRRPRDRAGHRGRADRHGRPRGLLLRQRGQLPGGDREPDA